MILKRRKFWKAKIAKSVTPVFNFLFFLFSFFPFFWARWY